MLLTAEKGLLGLSLTVLLGGAAVVLVFSRGPGADLVSGNAYTLTGSFAVQGIEPNTVINDLLPGEAVFGSWSRGGSHTGSFRSGEFRAPRILNFCVAGYPQQEGMSVYLEDADGRRLALRVLEDLGGAWRRLQWPVPIDWRGRTVRLVADDRSRAASWIGITLPREGGALGALALLGRAAGYAGTMAAEGALFLLPGVVFAMLLRRRFDLDGLRVTAVAFVGAAATGYLCFWIYFVSVNAGKVASSILLGGSLLALPWLGKRDWKKAAAVTVWREVVSAFALVLLAGWFYLGIGYAYNAGDSPGLQAANRFTIKQLPPDHLLPWMLAHHIYHEVPLRPYLLDVWKSSDRPPLQAGIALAQCPLWNVFDEETHYYLLAIFLQSLWIGAVWLFLRLAAVPLRSSLIVLSLCTFSGFFFFHSFYVWPKLLAAALFVLGVTFSTFNRLDYRWSHFDAVVSGAAIALGLLSHAGVLLAAPGVAWVLYRGRMMPRRRTIAWGVATVVLLYLPWVWYQKAYDPPGNLLLKVHLAGSLEQSGSFGRLVLDAYGKLSPGEWAYNKLENLRVLFVPDNFRPILSDDPRERYDAFTRGNFYSTFQALGLLNLGLLLRVRMWWKGHKAASSSELCLADRCVVAALVSTAIWCLIMFSPGSTIIHQGSLATMMLLFLAFGIYLASLAPRVAWFTCAMQILVLPLFVFGKLLFGNPPGTLMEGAVDSGFVALALIAMAGLLIWSRFVSTTSADAKMVRLVAMDGKPPNRRGHGTARNR